MTTGRFDLATFCAQVAQSASLRPPPQACRPPPAFQALSWARLLIRHKATVLTLPCQMQDGTDRIKIKPQTVQGGRGNESFKKLRGAVNCATAPLSSSANASEGHSTQPFSTARARHYLSLSSMTATGVWILNGFRVTA